MKQTKRIAKSQLCTLLGKNNAWATIMLYRNVYACRKKKMTCKSLRREYERYSLYSGRCENCDSIPQNMAARRGESTVLICEKPLHGVMLQLRDSNAACAISKIFFCFFFSNHISTISFSIFKRTVALRCVYLPITVLYYTRRTRVRR